MRQSHRTVEVIYRRGRRPGLSAAADPLPPPQHQETYRGIPFTVNYLGVCMFNALLPSISCRWAYWDRFLTAIESAYMSSGEKRLDTSIAIMRRAIDRAHAGDPCYTGDIRDMAAWVERQVGRIGSADDRRRSTPELAEL